MKTSIKNANFKFTELFRNCSLVEIIDALENSQASYNLCKLYSALSDIREAFGKPIIVNSGFRNIGHNLSVGGAKNSNHIVGAAADIKPQNQNDLQALEYVIRGNADLFCEIIVHPTFIHVAIK